MIKDLLKTALASATAVFCSLGTAYADEQCFANFKEIQNTYHSSNFDATVVNSIQSGTELYALTHAKGKNGRSYTTWKSLNNEVSGYGLRDLKGFDFNSNRSYIGPLLWHQSLLWDKLIYNGTELSGYECVQVGRTRLAGRNVSVMKLSPVDVRYSFVISSDVNTKLPVEIAVLTPSQEIIVKYTVTSLHSLKSVSEFFPDAAFDNAEKAQIGANSSFEVWPELFIPMNFKKKSSGIKKMGKDTVEFQDFSDGLVDFRVYRNTRSSVLIPTAADGTLTVFRINSDRYEYAVVGEIPLELSREVLKKITKSNSSVNR
ncbi:MAG: sigma-E factor regulatory protein RseB domain-containing protein [Succinivibrio sp.]